MTTESKVKEYHSKNYLRINGFYSNEIIVRIKELLPSIEEKYKDYCMYEESLMTQQPILHKIYSPIYLIDGLEPLLKIEELKNVIKEIWSEEVVLLTDKVNLKLPGGKGFAPHQDMQGVLKKYVDNIITAFISLDKSNSENGCIELAASEKFTSLLCDNDARSIPDEKLTNVCFEKIELNPGDLVMFDGFVPHKSGVNETDTQRMSLVLTFNKSANGNFRNLFVIPNIRTVY